MQFSFTLVAINGGRCSCVRLLLQQGEHGRVFPEVQAVARVRERLMEVVINVARPACRCQIPDTLIACWKGMGNIKVMDKWRWNLTKIIYVVMIFYSDNIYLWYLCFDLFQRPCNLPTPHPSTNLIGSGQIVWPNFSQRGHVPPVPPSGSAPGSKPIL